MHKSFKSNLNRKPFYEYEKFISRSFTKIKPNHQNWNFFNTFFLPTPLLKKVPKYLNIIMSIRILMYDTNTF